MHSSDFYKFLIPHFIKNFKQRLLHLVCLWKLLIKSDESVPYCVAGTLEKVFCDRWMSYSEFSPKGLIVQHNLSKFSINFYIFSAVMPFKSIAIQNDTNNQFQYQTLNNSNRTCLMNNLTRCWKKYVTIMGLDPRRVHCALVCPM